MDLSRLNGVRITPNARIKTINDYFPDLDEEILLDDGLNSRHLNMHAGALCLYATTLMTKVYETENKAIEYEASEREQELEQLIKADPKYSNLTEEQIKSKIKELTLKDIRNCFAHGNFEISYDIYTKRLYFVLKPRRKDFVVDKPIIISKEALTKINHGVLHSMGKSLAKLTKQELLNSVEKDIDLLMKEFLLPTTMMNLADRYLDKDQYKKKNLEIKDQHYYLIQYALLVTKIVYEQDDYYNIFGRDSDIFKRIALIRNAIAHDNFEFANIVKQIEYKDRDKYLNETLKKTTSSLIMADYQKETIIKAKADGIPEEELNKLIEDLKSYFDELFLSESSIFNI